MSSSSLMYSKCILSVMHCKPTSGDATQPTIMTPFMIFIAVALSFFTLGAFSLVIFLFVGKRSTREPTALPGRRSYSPLPNIFTLLPFKSKSQSQTLFPRIFGFSTLPVITQILNTAIHVHRSPIVDIEKGLLGPLDVSSISNDSSPSTSSRIPTPEPIPVPTSIFERSSITSSSSSSSISEKERSRFDTFTFPQLSPYGLGVFDYQLDLEPGAVLKEVCSSKVTLSSFGTCSSPIPAPSPVIIADTCAWWKA